MSFSYMKYVLSVFYAPTTAINSVQICNSFFQHCWVTLTRIQSVFDFHLHVLGRGNILYCTHLSHIQPNMVSGGQEEPTLMGEKLTLWVSENLFVGFLKCEISLWPILQQLVPRCSFLHQAFDESRYRLQRPCKELRLDYFVGGLV